MTTFQTNSATNILYIRHRSDHRIQQLFIDPSTLLQQQTPLQELKEIALHLIIQHAFKLIHHVLEQRQHQIQHFFRIGHFNPADQLVQKVQNDRVVHVLLSLLEDLQHEHDVSTRSRLDGARTRVESAGLRNQPRWF